MRRLALPALLLICGWLLTAPFAMAQQDSSSASVGSALQDAKRGPEEVIKEGARQIRQQTEEKVGTFAAYVDTKLAAMTSSPTIGYGALAVVVLVGIVSAAYGWTLIQSLLVPLAPVWGLLTGGVTAFCIIEAFYSEWETWFRLVLLTVGVTIGLALYLFSALRAKPVAAFLVILSPFVILAAFLFPQTQVAGLIIFLAGFVAGLAAMVEIRPLAIISTSLFGAACLLGGWGLLAHLQGEALAFIQDSFNWLLLRPFMLLLVLAVVTFIGANFQFGSGPRGTLAE